MPRLLTSTPRADGFRMPAEWAPHIGCWMLWPERSDNWRGGAKPAQHAFAAVAAAIVQGEPVTVCVSPAQYVIARAMLAPPVRVVEMTSNDSWIRDCGPTFVVNDQGVVRGVDWKFNAWGGLADGLYFPWDQDDLVGEKVIELERDDRYAPDFVLEGGSIDVDGEGSVLATEECLLNPNRNPGRSRGYSGGSGSLTFMSRSAFAQTSAAEGISSAPAAQYCSSVMPLPSPAPCSISTACPPCTRVLTPEGTIPTRNSFSLISFGTPMIIVGSPAYFVHLRRGV